MTNEDKMIRVCGATALAIFALLAVCFFLQGCKAHQIAEERQVATTTLQNNTEIRYIHTERIDTVLIQLPAETAERTTKKKESHLETNYAESDAWINEEGDLCHNLRNKTTPAPAPVKTSKDSVMASKESEKPVPIYVPQEVERQLTTWEKTRLKTWGWIATVLALCAGWIFRKPIIALARRMISKT